MNTEKWTNFCSFLFIKQQYDIVYFYFKIALLDIMAKTVAANVDIVLITYHVTMLPGIVLGDAYLVIRNKRVLKVFKCITFAEL